MGGHPYGKNKDFYDYARLLDLIQHPITIMGGGDGGAHCLVFQDAHGPSHLLTHWVKGRTRGPRLPIEMVVRKQTKEVALLFHLTDRGVIAAGMTWRHSRCRSRLLRTTCPQARHAGCNRSAVTGTRSCLGRRPSRTVTQQVLCRVVSCETRGRMLLRGKALRTIWHGETRGLMQIRLIS